MTRLAVFGDSIAWGSWDPEFGGWVNRLKLEYMRRQPSDSEPHEYIGVYTCATPGHRTADVLARIDSDLIAIDPDYIIIAIGTNDAAYAGSLSTDAMRFERNYRELLRRCLDVTPRVNVLTPPNVFGASFGHSNEELRGIGALLRTICMEHNVAVIDSFALLGADDFVADGLHPNMHGHEKIFRHVLTALSL